MSASTLSRRQLLLILISCTGCYCIANATWWLEPVLIDQLVTGRSLTPSRAGLVVSVEMIAMALTAFALAKLLKRGRFLPLGAVGVLLALLGSVLSLSTSAFLLLVVTRLITGIGEGFLFLVANTAIACFTNRDRTFAKMGIANVMFGVVLAELPSFVPALGNLPSAFMALLVALSLLALTVFLMPPSIKLTAEADVQSATPGAVHREAHLQIVLLSATTFLIGLASGIMWSFYGLIGKDAGMSADSVNSAVATSILTAIVGSSLAALLGNSLGRLLPVSIALAIMTLAIVSLCFHPSPWAFRVATCVNVSTLYFIMPYLFAAGSVQDETGLGATYVGSAFLMTGAVSPFLGGVLVDTVGTEFIGGAAVVTAIISGFLFAHVQRRTLSLQTAASTV